MNSKTTDVLIIGGGPAGSTFGNLAAQRGWQVAMLEKDEHPRFHIGESLLPMNLPIFERLGVIDKIRRIGVPKLGADFTIANSGDEHQTFYFGNALGESPDHAFEVRRSELDNGNHVVIAVDAAGQQICWETRFLVDASGRDTFMSASRGWKRRNPRHASAAVFAHFRGVERRSGDDQGNISIYWFEHGWIWLIPLREDIMSVGAVCYPEYIKTRRGSLDGFLLETLHSLDEIRERMRAAEPATAAQATGNYSYLSSRMSGDGYLMIGDAYAFIDPVFSSGVYLAMSSAASGVEVADAWLRGSALRYRLACRRHRKMLSRGIGAFSWFIYRFTTPAMRFLMSNPRNTFRVVEGVISMLAGDVFANPAVRRRLFVFKVIYSAAWLFNWRESLVAGRRRRNAVHERLHGTV
jgi:flavin-dependent dehydrogenase